MLNVDLREKKSSSKGFHSEKYSAMNVDGVASCIVFKKSWEMVKCQNDEGKCCHHPQSGSEWVGKICSYLVEDSWQKVPSYQSVSILKLRL